MDPEGCPSGAEMKNLCIFASHDCTRHDYDDPDAFELLTLDDVRDEIQKNLHWVSINTVEEFQLLKNACSYFDERQSGFLGRCMETPLWNLQRGDRLEPQEALPDPHLLETMHPPFRLKFFRSKTSQRYLRESPIWNLFGFSLTCVAVDLLHAFDLGILSRFFAFTFHEVLKHGAVLTRFLFVQLTASQAVKSGVAELKGRLQKHYGEMRAAGLQHHTEFA